MIQKLLIITFTLLLTLDWAHSLHESSPFKTEKGSTVAQAIVFVGVDKQVVIKDIPLPNLREGEILVKNTFSTICGSAIQTYLGHRTTPPPTILSHEIIREIVAFGPDSEKKTFQGIPLTLEIE
ncbi:MAG: hypothetical protein ACI9S8_001914 [Chlamydiales bacterium]|jgi:hypothetical protein